MTPGPRYSFGYNRDAMEFFSGTETRYGGKESWFDPFAPLSILMMNRCKTEGQCPMPRVGG